MKKVQIGILTFHHSDNAGAVLQAYALQKVLNRFDKTSAEIIDYRCRQVESTRYAANKGRNTWAFIRFAALTMYYLIKRRGFKRFRKRNLDLSDETYVRDTIASCGAEYDIYIAGSDQIWNPECSGCDESYLLDFVSEGKQKYSYAASMGNYLYTEAGLDRLCRLLSGFQAVSVREMSAAGQLRKLKDKEILVHPDPVFLLDRSDWLPVMSKRLLKEKYILVYLIQPDTNALKAAQNYAENQHCRIINNKTSPQFMLHNSPSDFLSWIYYAEAVFTNSFHGTAFSLIFQKRLGAEITLKNGGINLRVKELLDLAESSCCILEKNNNKAAACKNGKSYLENSRRNGIQYLELIVRNGSFMKNKEA